MSDTVVDTLDQLRGDFPMLSGGMSLLDEVFGDTLGPFFLGGNFFNVFVDFNNVDTLVVEVGCVFPTLKMAIPGLSSLALIVGQDDGLEIDSGIMVDPTKAQFWLDDVPISLRCTAPGLLTPAVKTNDIWRPDVDGNGIVKQAEAILSGARLDIDTNGNIEIAVDAQVDLAPVLIGQSGVVVEMRGLRACLSDTSALPPGVPAGSRGFAVDSVDIYLPKWIEGTFVPNEFQVDNIFVGSGGFSADITAAWSPGKVITLGGFECTLNSLLLNFKQNAIVESQLECELTLPFFDRPINLDVSLSGDGTLLATLSAVQPPNVQYVSGLIEFDMASLLHVAIASLSFELKDGDAFVILSGKLQPLVHIGGNAWPAFDVRELRIDSHGRVHLDGGWLPLPEQYALALNGFNVEISAMTFGKNDDGRNFMGFTGEVQLATGALGLGAKFKNLLISWRNVSGNPPADIEISLRGVVVDLNTDVLRFHGSVDFIKEQDQTGFRGSIELALYNPALTINAELLCVRVGSPQYTAFYVYANANFPGGIMLGATGLELTGFAGIYGQNVRPDKLEQEDWFAHWYKGVRLDDKRQGGPANVDTGTSLGVTGVDKWQPEKGKLALGAGVTFGTVGDGGYAVNGKVLFLVLLPGPIIMFDGRANILTKASKLRPGSDGAFKAFAVLDVPAGTLQFNIGADYRKNADASIIHIEGDVDAFFDFHRANNWHLYIGERTPEAKRIRATIFRLFQANSYFMLSPRRLEIGFWVGFKQQWTPGPLRVALEAWISTDAALSWKPNHLSAQCQLHGFVELSAFGVGLSITVDALIAAETPTPFHLLAALHVALNLPWPLPDLAADVQIEWGPKPDVAPFPLLLESAAAEHRRVTEKFPLDRLAHLDPSGDGFVPDPPPADTSTLDQLMAFGYDEDDLQGHGIGLPIVPLDATIVLTFAKPVYDNDIVFGNRRPGAVERVGDSTFSYHLRKVALYRIARSLQPGSSPPWDLVEERPSSSSAAPGHLAGMWQLVSSGNDSLVNTSLMLGARSTSESTREGGTGYWNWLQQALPDQNCPKGSTPYAACVNFEVVDGLAALQIVGDPAANTFTFKHDGLVFTVAPLAPLLADRFIEAFARSTALALPVPPNGQIVLTIDLPRGVSWAQIQFDPESPFIVQGNHVSRQGRNPVGSVVITDDIGQPRTATITDLTGRINQIALIGGPQVTAGKLPLIYLYQVCYKGILNPDTQLAADTWPQVAAEAQEIWNRPYTLFEPDSIYKLEVRMEVARSGGSLPKVQQQVQRQYFQTAQPPGVLTRDTPAPTARAIEPGTVDVVSPPGKASLKEHFPTLGPLADLSAYIASTVPARGQRPYFRAYDVKVLFNEPYVQEMYDHAQRPLKLLVVDGNGEPVVDNLPLAWADNPDLALSMTEAEMLFSLQQAAAAGCIPALDLSLMPKDQEAIATSPDLLLAPEALHVGRLVSNDGNANTIPLENTPWDPYTVFSWSFVTSRFACFRDQVGSFGGRTWDEHVLRGQPSTPLLDGLQLAEIGNLLIAEMAHTPLTSSDPPRFAQVAAMLGFGTVPQPPPLAPGVWQRPAPRSIEVTVLRDATRGYGFLIESPEPFDPARAALGSGANPQPDDVAIQMLWTPTMVPLPAARGAAAILDGNIAPVSGMPDDEFIDLLVIDDNLDLSGWTIEHSGSAAVFPVYSVHFIFPPTGSPNRQGSVVRVHTSVAAANPPADMIHHYAGLGAVALGATGGTDRLRLLDATGTVVHARALFAHRPVHEVARDATVLWNHDRTAAFLFLASGSNRVAPFADGVYRLPCRFRRLLPADTDAPILSQRQSTEDEALYIEWIVGAEAFHAQNGDFDQDGTITAADVLEIAGKWQLPPVGPLARFDLNGDGVVDVLDIQSVAAHVGREL